LFLRSFHISPALVHNEHCQEGTSQQFAQKANTEF
jgi:hypothetical protein